MRNDSCNLPRPKEIINDVISNEELRACVHLVFFTKAFICEVVSLKGTPGGVHVEGLVCRIYRV